MRNVNHVGERATKRLCWIARIWSVVIIAFALLVIIGAVLNLVTTGKADPYAVEGYPAIENLPPLLAFLIILGLCLAWRWEKLGGVIAVVFSIAIFPLLLIHWPIARNFPYYLVAPYGVWLMIAIPGVLFVICGWRLHNSKND